MIPIEYKAAKLHCIFSKLVYYDQLDDKKKYMPKGWRLYKHKHFKFRAKKRTKRGLSSNSLSKSSKILSESFYSRKLFRFDIYENYEKKHLIIAFKGTNWADLDDIKDDLMLAIGYDPEIADEVEKIIKETIEFKENYKITFTGHSLGGHYAIRMSLRFNKRAIVFDPPWVSNSVNELLLNNKNEDKEIKNISSECNDIHSFVISPNFVNCTNRPIGKLYRVSYQKNNPTWIQVVKKEYGDAGLKYFSNLFGEGLRGFINESVLPAIISFFLGSLLRMEVNAEQVRNAASKAGELIANVREICQSACEAGDGIAAKISERWTHTLETHSLNCFIHGIFENYNNIQQIDLESWPSSNGFLLTALNEWNIRCISSDQENKPCDHKNKNRVSFNSYLMWGALGLSTALAIANKDQLMDTVKTICPIQ